MRKLIFLFSLLFCSLTYANTETITWTVDGQTYATTSCESGDDIVLPNPPTKNGFTFAGWKGYTPVEFLESSGPQYIDTGFIPDDDTSLQITFMVTKLQTYLSDATVPVGGRVGWQNENFGIMAPVNQTNNTVIFTGFSVIYVRYDPLQKLTTLIIDVPNNYIKLSAGNQTIFESDSSVSYSSYHNSLYLFDMNENGNHWGNERGLRIYNVLLKNNNTLVRDMIPVLDDAGVACMFDRVTNQFFYNAGTGDFIAGPIVTE